jgi:diguanylate cyclase (GGDEF)-like protein
VLFCDLDGFKSLNDTLSHRAGDEVLVEVADRLRTAIGPHDSVARLGGDEFVVVARSLTDSAEAVTIGQSLCDAIAAPFRVDGRTVRLGLSVGVSTTSDPSSSTEDLLRQADLAMYSAKDNGRNRVEVYVPELQAAAIERMAVEEQLREAIAQATVAVDYQPIISLSGSGVTAVEALVRVPTTLPISAADFVEVAQRTGLMSTLGEQILRRVGQDVRDWAALGFRIRVHVNVSRAQLQDPDFMAMCEAALGPGISSDQVCFEVSDPTVLSDSEAVVQTLWELRGRGFHVGIDGFGAGHAGLATLRRIPADYLKIDRCFLVNLATAREDQVIVAAIVQLAHQLGRTVIATGVETAEQREMLRTLGCDEIQGYLHSPAVAADLVPGLVQRMTRTVPARRG